MSGKICCEEVTVPQELEMNDRDLLNDILYSQKQITVNTITALTETSNIVLHDEIEKIFEDVEKLQRKSFELAWNKGWYTLEEVGVTKIKESITNLNTKLEELN
ncbi:MAG: spore coat protein [Bacilli bacterium]|nr:spore coat protein [Bacilli bacterium]